MKLSLRRTAPLGLLAALFLLPPLPAQDDQAKKDDKKKDELELSLENIFPEKGLFGPSARGAAFSADGRYAAWLYRPYLERRHGSDLWVRDFESGETRRITSVSVLAPYQTDVRKVGADRVKKARKAAKGLPPPLVIGPRSGDTQKSLATRRSLLDQVLFHPELSHPQPARRAAPKLGLLGPLAGNARIQKASWSPEPRLELPGLLVAPPMGPKAAKGVILYLADAGKQSAVHAVALAEAGYIVHAMDLAGIGELTPRRRYRYGLGRPGLLFMQDFFGVAFLHILGDSLYALRISQIRKAARLLARTFAVPVGVLGQGTECGVYALTAGALEPDIAGVAALDPLRSLKREILKARFPAPGLVHHGVLRAVDTHTLAALSAPRPVLIIGGCASDGTPDPIRPSRDYRETLRVYRHLGYSHRLVIKSAVSSHREHVLKWAARLANQRRME